MSIDIGGIGGNLESKTGDVNFNDSNGGNITQIKNSGQLDLSMLKLFLKEEGTLEKHEDKVESLEAAIKNKDKPRIEMILGYLLKVTEAAALKWVVASLLKFV